MQPDVSIPQTGIQNNNVSTASSLNHRYEKGKLGNAVKYAAPSLIKVNLFDVYREQTKEMLPLTFLQKSSWEKFSKQDFDIICKVGKAHKLPVPDTQYKVDYICEVLNYFKSQHPNEEVKFQFHKECLELSVPFDGTTYWVEFQQMLDAPEPERSLYMMAAKLMIEMGWQICPPTLGYLEDYASQYGDEDDIQSAEEMEKEFNTLYKREKEVFKKLKKLRINWVKYTKEMIKPTPLGLFLHMVYHLRKENFNLNNYTQDGQDDYDEGLEIDNCFILFVNENTHNLREEISQHEQSGYQPAIERKLYFPNGKICHYSQSLFEVAAKLSYYEPTKKQFIFYDSNPKSITAIANSLHLQLGRRVECVYRSYIRRKRDTRTGETTRKNYALVVGPASNKNDKPTRRN